MPTRILLINDNTAHLNWGAQASPPALVEILKSSIHGCDVTALPHAWLTREYRRLRRPLAAFVVRGDCRRVLRPMVYRCSVPVTYYPSVADDFDDRAEEWMRGRGGPQAQEFLRLANAADLIVYNGENSIYRNTPEGCHGLFLLWLAKSRLGKPSCIVNHTAHLNDVRPILKGMVQLVYPVLDLVAVRECSSMANLVDLGIDNVRLFPDVVFGLEPSTFPRASVDEWRLQNGLGNQSYFCLSASGLPMSLPRGDWDGEVAALVKELKATGLQGVLVAKDPWCLPLEAVARRTGTLFFGPEHAYHDLWPLFEGAEVLVTGHYHYAIFAAMVGCPFVPLSVNNHKMSGLCELLELERKTIFDATFLRDCRDEIVGEIQSLRTRRTAVSQHLLRVSGSLRAKARELGVLVAEAADLQTPRGQIS